MQAFGSQFIARSAGMYDSDEDETASHERAASPEYQHRMDGVLDGPSSKAASQQRQPFSPLLAYAQRSNDGAAPGAPRHDSSPDRQKRIRRAVYIAPMGEAPLEAPRKAPLFSSAAERQRPPSASPSARRATRAHGLDPRRAAQLAAGVTRTCGRQARSAAICQRAPRGTPPLVASTIQRLRACCLAAGIARGPRVALTSLRAGTGLAVVHAPARPSVAQATGHPAPCCKRSSRRDDDAAPSSTGAYGAQ